MLTTPSAPLQEAVAIPDPLTSTESNISVLPLGINHNERQQNSSKEDSKSHSNCYNYEDAIGKSLVCIEEMAEGP